MSQFADIISSVPTAFDKALKAGDLFFYPSTIHSYQELSVKFEVRLCPALQKKPHLPTPHFDKPEPAWIKHDPKQDPFGPPYVQNLLVGELKDEEDEEYVVLLNKFSIVRHHFLLVTKLFKSQSSPLTPPDLALAYTLIMSAKRLGKPIFGFYNCGDNSGASQPHKHVQFVPAENDGPPIEHVVRRASIEASDKPFSLSTLPYAHHIFRFPSYLSSVSSDELEAIVSRAFLYLLDLTVSSLRLGNAEYSGKPSYNVIMTSEHMHLIPRSRENYTLSATGAQLPINSLGFAGLLLVKSETELEAVQQEGVGKILSGVGIASTHEIQAANCAHV